jgi:hypothetical protein
MENILILVVAALIGEAVWETLKMVWQEGKLSIDRVGALVVGLLIAVAGGLDLPAQMGVPLAIPYVGMILTGILISRGANFVHELLRRLQTQEEE